jgi:hypothetical protein
VSEDSTDTRHFIWDDFDDSTFTVIRKLLMLEMVERKASNEFERVWQTCVIVHSLWQHDGAAAASAPDPVAIIEEASAGGRFRCVEYALVLQAALGGLGLRARRVILMTRDVETRETMAAHVAVEVYLREYGRWALADAQLAACPIVRGEPVSAWDVRHAIVQREPLALYGRSVEDTVLYCQWLRPYLSYFYVQFDTRFRSAAANTSGLLLMEEGARPPRVVQGRWPLRDVIFTRNPALFYLAPD